MHYRSNTINNKLGNKTITLEKSKNLKPKRGEVWVARNLEFEQKIGCKTRPIVILSCSNGKVRYLRCTSSNGPQHAEILDGGVCGLKAGTFLRQVVEVTDLSRLDYRMGKLGAYDMELIESPYESGVVRDIALSRAIRC